MSNVSDASILNELEVRGIDAFLSEMRWGLVVPTCFMKRVIAIVEENYAIDLVTTGKVHSIEQGTFCSMSYNDTSVTLIDSQNY